MYLVCALNVLLLSLSKAISLVSDARNALGDVLVSIVSNNNCSGMMCTDLAVEKQTCLSLLFDMRMVITVVLFKFFDEGIFLGGGQKTGVTMIIPQGRSRCFPLLKVARNFNFQYFFL